MQTKLIQPLHINQQKVLQDKQNCFVYTHVDNLYQLQNYNSRREPKQKDHNQRKGLLAQRQSFSTKNKRAKTINDSLNENPSQDFLKTFYNTSQQFIRTHKPFLQNKRIVFNVKNRNRSNFLSSYIKNQENNLNVTDMKIDIKTEQRCRNILKQSNIEKLKKEIIQLDKQDFVSYRSKGFSQPDEIKIVQNQKINKYNYQNSMIVQWKGKFYQKPFIARPSSTIGISNLEAAGNGGAFIGNVSHTSMAKKYFSKPKTRKNYAHSKTAQIHGSNINMQLKQNNPKTKLKTQQIAIGLNMFRGKLHRKKINSSFQIHY